MKIFTMAFPGLKLGWNTPRNPEAAEESLAVVAAAGIPGYRHALPALAAELRRSRRYEHPLTFLILALEATHRAELRAEGGVALADAGGGDRDGMLYLPQAGHDARLIMLLGMLLRESLRETDLIAYVAEARTYAVALPETDEAAALQALARLAGLVHLRALARLRAGIAVFPNHGLTIEDLYYRARASWQQRPVVAGMVAEAQEATHA